MSYVAIIPAKGNSTRIPWKNRKLFFGNPIIAYSIATARASRLFDRIIVSTECDEMHYAVEKYGVEVQRRPKELAEDRYGPLDVAGHVLFTEQYRFDFLPEFACCISATAPLMTVEDLHCGLAALKANPSAQYAFGMGTEPPKDAGVWYWGKPNAFIRGLPLVDAHSIMVPVPENRCCDIDTPEDWARAERMYAALYDRPMKHPAVYDGIPA